MKLDVPRGRTFQISPALALFIVLFLGTLVRLWISYKHYGTFDVNSWEKIFHYWQDGRTPYDAERRYAYTPVWFWILSVFSVINSVARFPDHFMIKMPLILADLGIVWLLWKQADRMGLTIKEKLVAVIFFFLNPVSFLCTSYLGQFDNLAYAFVLAACISEYSGTKRKASVTFLLLAAAFMVKQSILLIVPLFAFRQKTWRQKAFFLMMVPLPSLLTLIPYLATDFHTVYQSVILDSMKLRLLPYVWGWTVVANHAWVLLFHSILSQSSFQEWVARYNLFLYPLLFITAYYLAKFYDLVEAVILYLLIFYAFTTILAPQYAVWILPFAALRRDKMLLVYSAVTTATYLVFFEWHAQYCLGNMIEERRMAPLLASMNMLSWAVVVAWLISKRKTLTNVQPRGAPQGENRLSENPA